MLSIFSISIIFVKNPRNTVLSSPLSKSNPTQVKSAQKEQLFEKEISLNVTQKAKDSLLNLGFDSVNGARPMARVIQDQIKIPLANLLLKSSKNKRNALVDYSEKESKFKILLTDDLNSKESIYH
mgnify:CR=1 FL=1